MTYFMTSSFAKFSVFAYLQCFRLLFPIVDYVPTVKSLVSRL